jgi:hypothetical protein
VKHIQLGFLSWDGLSLLADHFEIPSESAWQCAAEVIMHSLLSSVIISDFPAIFVEFRGKRFSLLWRGIRDGFGASDFHGRCDGYVNTLTVILDTDRNIFGGFTPVEWDSTSRYKANYSLKSFVFTLKNPHNVKARRFVLKAKEKDDAIYWDDNPGLSFYGGIHVSNHCNTVTFSSTESFGKASTNDTGLDGDTFVTGSHYFKVKEIEVVEIATKRHFAPSCSPLPQNRKNEQIAKNPELASKRSFSRSSLFD